MMFMIYKRARRQCAAEPGGFFHLENDVTHRKVYGYGQGSAIKLEDAAGNVWRGSAERGDDEAIFYRFRTQDGGLVSGIGYGKQIMLRDAKGKTWKGFVD